MIREYNIREKLPQLFEEGGVRKAFEGLILGYTDNPDRELLEGVSLPDDYTKEEEGFICACLFIGSLWDRDGIFPSILETPREQFIRLSPFVRDRKEFDKMRTTALQALSIIRSLEVREERKRGEGDLMELAKKARRAAPPKTFKAAKDILPIAWEEDPEFLAEVYTLGYELEQQSQEFGTDKDNTGILQQLPESFVRSYNIDRHKGERVWYINIADHIKKRRQDPNYRPSSVELERVGNFLRKLEDKSIIKEPTGIIDADGEELIDIHRAIEVHILKGIKGGEMKHAIIIARKYFDITSGYNRLPLKAIPQRKISEIEKRLDIFLSQKKHTKRIRESFFLEELFHELQVSTISHYKTTGKKVLERDLYKSLDSVTRRGIITSWGIKKTKNGDKIEVHYC